jgi:hypothetical protein
MPSELAVDDESVELMRGESTAVLLVVVKSGRDATVLTAGRVADCAVVSAGTSLAETVVMEREPAASVGVAVDATRSIGMIGSVAAVVFMKMSMSPSVVIAVPFSPWRRRGAADAEPSRIRGADRNSFMFSE